MSKLTKILWSNGLLQKPILLIVEEKFYEQNVVASISHSIFDQIKFPGGVLNPLDKPIQKLFFGIQFHQDLMEKTKEQADALCVNKAKF